MSHTDPPPPLAPQELLRETAVIVAAYLNNNKVDRDELPDLIAEVYQALGAIAASAHPLPPAKQPAVPVEDSVTADYIVCLEDGKKLKMLKRYLRTHFDLSPDQYRERWGLPADYPMVAPNYAAKRAEVARDMGLGASPDKRGKRGSRKQA